MEFEVFCLDILKAYAESEGLTDFEITHNKKIKATDGEYQIDLYAEFVAMSVKFKVVVEYKCYTHSIKREKVSTLFAKVQSLGANKGVLISTSGYQTGAVEYAKKHGISLIQIIDKEIMHIQASIHLKKSPEHIEFIKQSPPYYALQWSGVIPDFPDKKYILLLLWKRN